MNTDRYFSNNKALGILLGVSLANIMIARLLLSIVHYASVDGADYGLAWALLGLGTGAVGIWLCILFDLKRMFLILGTMEIIFMVLAGIIGHKGWLNILDINIYPSAMLAVCGFGAIALMAGCRRLGSGKCLMLIFAVLLAISWAAFWQSNFTAALVCMLALTATVCLMKKDEFVTLSWKRILIPILLVAGMVLFLLLTQTWYGERLAAFISGSDPFGYGWYRHVAGCVFHGAGFLYGCDGLEIGGLSGAGILSGFRNSRLLLLLFEYGWAAVFFLLFEYGVCLWILVIMAMRIWKSEKTDYFSKYSAVYAVCVLFIQSLFSLSGLLFADSGLADMPLLSGNIWITGMDCLLITVVIRLYIKMRIGIKGHSTEGSNHAIYNWRADS